MTRYSSTQRGQKYGRPAIALHWLVAGLMIAGFALGWFMTDIPGFTPAKLRYYSWHKWIGCTVLALAIVRIAWRIRHAAPPPPGTSKRWQRVSAELVHRALYVLMLVIPVTGYLYSSSANVPVVFLGIVPLPRLIAPDPVLKPILKEIHVVLNYVLLVLVATHVLAALKHHFIDRDGLLHRMLPF
ncbi:cytochrome b [Burkholderia cenocepacia]|uniref:cytochrome b n=1 Tax=Burkholderia cenocepacia TaxID=95486 RepID=UPI0023B8CE97|nr:cytochrome b [Burkholderia cenocepacia]MDF0500596.1 cytochrome b [Burkholderia cenocepacia]MDN7846977.1 cytochrome b [Burkholderia multivorans]